MERALRAAAAAGIAIVLAGCSDGLLEIIGNDYPSLGMWRNARWAMAHALRDIAPAAVFAAFAAVPTVLLWARWAAEERTLQEQWVVAGIVQVVLLGSAVAASGVAPLAFVPTVWMAFLVGALLLAASLGAPLLRVAWLLPAALGGLATAVQVGLFEPRSLWFHEASTLVGVAVSLGSVLGSVLVAWACLRVPIRGLGAFCAAVLGAMGLGMWGPSATATGPNVLILGLDTTRGDHIELEGPGPRDLTPNLRALSQRGTAYTDAVSQAPWTLPGFVSILTGLYPHQHGASSLDSTVPRAVVTLHERMLEAGYRTGVTSTNAYCGPKVTFDQGVMALDMSTANWHFRRTSDRISGWAADFIEAGGGPAYVFVAYIDPHTPLLNHPENPWADDYDGWMLRVPEAPGHLVQPEDVQFLNDLYDEEIAYTDAAIGRLVERLERSGALDDTLVIVVGDHGEEIYERGYFGHTTTLHQEVLGVPLIVVPPGGAPARRVTTPVETRRVTPTVLAQLGLPWSGDARPLPDRDEPDAIAFSELNLLGLPASWGLPMGGVALTTADWRWIQTTNPDVDELYRRGEPEITSLADVHPEVVDELRGRSPVELDASYGARAATERSLSVSEREALKVLGYVQ